MEKLSKVLLKGLPRKMYRYNDLLDHNYTMDNNNTKTILVSRKPRGFDCENRKWDVP
jgi:hypothetical protein